MLWAGEEPSPPILTNATPTPMISAAQAAMLTAVGHFPTED
jgi:hypothetical protein